jgi:hypothetical protein
MLRWMRGFQLERANTGFAAKRGSQRAGEESYDLGRSVRELL